MKTKSIVLMATALMLATVLAVGGTLAYFTDTKSAENTFTVGNVTLDLTESSWNATDASHKLVPGVPIAKDPSIELKSGSENAYVVATITVNHWSAVKAMMTANSLKSGDQYLFCDGAGTAAILNGGIADEVSTYNSAITIGTTQLGAGFQNDDFAIVSSENAAADTATYTIYFTNPWAAGTAKTLFDTVTMPASASSDEMDDIKGDVAANPFTVTVNAYAIQAAGFDNVATAYAAYTQQNS